MDDDGTVLKEATEYAAGTSANDIVKPADPTKADTNEYTYTFAGWSPTITDVNADATYYATYTATKKQYNYTIHHYLKGTTTPVKNDETGTAAYGTTVTATPATTYESRNLTVDSYNPKQAITINEGSNVITIYYTLPLEIKANDNSKTYGATDPALTVAVSGALSGDTISTRATRAAGENVGTYTITPSAENVPGYYDVSYKPGTFTITQADLAITITGNKSETPYSGGAQTVSGYTATSSNSGFDASKVQYSGTASVTQTNAGTYPMGLAQSGFSYNDSNYKVSFTVNDGELKINKITANVTITGHNASNDYDGSAHSVTGYDVVSDTTLFTADSISFSGTASAERTAAGTTNMGLAQSQFTSNNQNIDAVFTVVDGYQTISPIDVTVTIVGANNTAAYDGAEHTVNGYTATANSTLYNVENDFTFSGTQTAAQKDAGTKNMGLAAGQFKNNNNNFNVTFDVTDGYQTITPINATVTIVGAVNATDYDGAEHTVTGYTATADTKLYDVTKDFSFTGSASATRTVAGTTNMGLAAGRFSNTNPNFDTVTFNVTDGYQTINPIDTTVTITGHHDSSTFDGKEYSVSGYDVEISNPLYKETDFTFNGTAIAARTVVGKTDMGLAASQFTNKNANFGTVTFNVTDGYQEIVPVDEVVVTITGHNNTTNYDGAEHSVSGYDVEISNPLYTEADFTFSGTAAAARTVAGTTDMGLDDEQFINNNNNFAKVTFNVTDGYQTITPINVTVTVTGANNTTDYDGEEHTVTAYTAVANNELYDVTKDFTFTGTAAAARTDAGTTNMGLNAEQFANTNNNFATVTFNVTDGYQTINPIDAVVTITGANNTAAYDGTEHRVSGYTATASTNLYDVNSSFTFSGTDEAARTDAGKADMGLKAEQFTNINNNFKSVTFNVTDGYQEITPIDVTVTVTGANNTTDYDGEAHSVSGYTATADSILYDVDNDFTFSGTASAARTDAGTTNMGLQANQFTNTNQNFGTVTFEVTDGYQTISPIDVTVSVVGANNTADYDGQPHTVNGYTATANSALYNVNSDIRFTGNAAASLTTVGMANMNLTSGQFTNTNPNFGTVTFNVTDGYQTINPIDVTVTVIGKTGTATYDGADHTITGYDVSISNPLYTEADFTFSGNASATRKDVGTADMGLAVDQFDNTNTNFGTVTFNVTDGHQTIEKAAVTVTVKGHKGTENYDGSEHKAEGYDLSFSNSLYTADDITFTGTASAARTNAGTTSMNLTVDQFANTNDNFNATFVIAEDGSITINPIDATVTITGHNNSTTYDGAEHSISGYDVEYSTALYTAADFTFSGTAEAARTDVGRTQMNLAADQFANTNDNFGTVTFNVTDGYQDIVAVDEVVVTITGHNNTTNYDGAEHSVSGYDVEISNPLYTEDDFTFSGTAAAAARTDAGTTNMGLAAGQFSNQNVNFAKVIFNVTDGYQAINKIPATVTITGHNNATDYDGTEHSVSGYDVAISTPLYTESDFSFNGTAGSARTDAGQTNMGLAAGQFANTNDNFENVIFNVTDGYQKINPIDVTVTITGHTASAEYDSEAHTVTGYDVVISNPLYKESDFTFSGTAEAIRTDFGTTSMNLASGQFANTNPNFDSVTFNVTDGSQSITRKPVTVTAAAGTKVYGTAEPALTATVSGTLGSDTVSYTVTRESGENVGTYPITASGDAEQGNYSVSYEGNTFTITPSDAMTVTATGYSGTYDGQTHFAGATANVIAGTTIEYSTDNGTTWSTGVPSITNVGTVNVLVRATNDNYITKTAETTLTVTPAQVTVTAQNASRTYGEADPETFTATVTGLIGNDTVAYTVSREGGDDAGTYRIIPTGAATQGNYAVSYADGTFTINQKLVTLTADNNSKIYGAEDPTLTARITTGELVGNDTLNYTLSRAVGENVGNYTITVTPGENPNYAVTVKTGTFTISQKPVTVTAENKTKTYGDNDPELTAVVNGLVGDDTLNYTLSREEGENVGSYDINVTLGDNPNYAVTANKGTLTVSPKAVTITTGSDSKEYNGTALTKDEADIEGLVEGESVTLAATGTITEIGETDN
ncbi:MAG: hypothetical protein E7325_10905, partial [Clostridiales bacterium]|nr:hypothetical protein [Clostridiales bacterium]